MGWISDPSPSWPKNIVEIQKNILQIHQLVDAVQCALNFFGIASGQFYVDRGRFIARSIFSRPAMNLVKLLAQPENIHTVIFV